MKRPSLLLNLLVAILLVTGCTETRTNNAAKSYQLWAGEKAGNDIEPIKGQYWQSAHFTREYIVYLELAPGTTWKQAFIKQNHLIAESTAPILPGDAPAWFKLPPKTVVWKKTDGSNGVYFENPINHHFFIYEEQL